MIEPHRARAEDALRSFDGSPLAEKIKEVLDSANYQYDRYNNYQGFPSNTSYGPGHRSPIIDLVDQGIQDGTIVEELPDIFTTRFVPTDEYADLLDKLSLFDSTILRDSKSGDVVGYVVGLTAGGRRQDHAIVGPKALTVTKADAAPITDSLADHLSN